MCGSMRSGPKMEWTAGLNITTKEGTIITTTVKTLCSHCGTPRTQQRVTARKSAGGFLTCSIPVKAKRDWWRAAVLPFNRCHHLYDYSPAGTYGPALPPSAVWGHESAQPLLTRSPGRAPISSPPPQYFGPPRPSYQTLDVGLDHVGSVWQPGQQQCCPTHRCEMANTNPAKDFPIRIIRVWGQSEKTCLQTGGAQGIT